MTDRTPPRTAESRTGPTNWYKVAVVGFVGCLLVPLALIGAFTVAAFAYTIVTTPSREEQTRRAFELPTKR